MDTGKYHDTIEDLDEPYNPNDWRNHSRACSCPECEGDPSDYETTEDKMTWYDLDPSDIELARRDAMIERGYLHLAAMIAGAVAGAVAGLLVLVVGLSMFTGDAHAQDSDKIYGSYPINDRIYEWPYIGTRAYSRSCSVYQAWEDGSARAYCTEDGATYTFDPEDNTWTPVTNAR